MNFYKAINSSELVAFLLKICIKKYFKKKLLQLLHYQKIVINN